MVFLHPSQRHAVERNIGGPARVSSGVGTGETVVALHRAVAPTGCERRLASLLEMLSIEPVDVAELRYQLIHRTAATLLEAQRYRAEAAMMLVHSFSPEAAGFDHFRRFAYILGAPVEAPGGVFPPITRLGTRLTLGWVADRVRAP